jgi:hypothetical protein
MLVGTARSLHAGAYPFTGSGLQAPAEIRSVSVVAPAVWFRIGVLTYLSMLRSGALGAAGAAFGRVGP